MTAKAKPNLIAIDLLRFACALLVVAFHYGLGIQLLPPPGGATLIAGATLDRGLMPFVNSGWVGVELFFVVSGFVIAWSAENAGAGDFLRRRAARLLPAAWLCSSVTAIAFIASGAMPLTGIGARWIGSVLFSPTMMPIDPSYWTLAIEVNFYLTVALLLRGGSYPARIERLGIALGCASAIYWATSLFVPVPSVMHDRLMQLSLLPHGCFFAIGIMLRMRQRSGASAARMLLLIPFLGAAALEIGAHRRDLLGQDVVHVPALLVFMAGVLTIAFADRLQPWLERRIPPAAAINLGLMTYPLYLLHHEIGAMTIGVLVNRGVPFLLAAGTAFLLSLSLAWLVMAIGEPWLRARFVRMLTGWLNHHRVPRRDSRPSAFPPAG